MPKTRPLSADERWVVAQVLESLDCPQTDAVNEYLDRLRVELTSSRNWIEFAPSATSDVATPELGIALAVLADTGVAIDVLAEEGEVIGGIRLHAREGAFTTMNQFLLSGMEPVAFPRPEQFRIHQWRTRPLTPDEYSVMWRIIDALPGPERLPLQAQLAHVSVTAGSIATWTDLVVDPAAVPVSFGGSLDVGADVLGPDGNVIGDIAIVLKYADGGYLGSIDFVWFGDLRPEVFPRPNEVQIRHASLGPLERNG